MGEQRRRGLAAVLREAEQVSEGNRPRASRGLAGLGAREGDGSTAAPAACPWLSTILLRYDNDLRSAKGAAWLNPDPSLPHSNSRGATTPPNVTAGRRHPRCPRRTAPTVATKSVGMCGTTSNRLAIRGRNDTRSVVLSGGEEQVASAGLRSPRGAHSPHTADSEPVLSGPRMICCA